jgi:hypothetical protein
MSVGSILAAWLMKIQFTLRVESGQRYKAVESGVNLVKRRVYGVAVREGVAGAGWRRW